MTATAMTLLAAGPPDVPQHLTRVVQPDPRTGKLVRSVVLRPNPMAGRSVPAAPVQARVATPAGAVSAPVARPVEIDDAVDWIAIQQSLPAQVIHSVIKVESNYNPYAVSSKGASGIMQLMPSTARRFGVSNVFDPVDNIQGGARYLRHLLDLYNGDYRLALAAYNAGEGAVGKYGDVPPYPETQNYVTQVGQQLRKSLDPAPAKPAAQTAPQVAQESPPDGPAPIHAVVGPDGIVHYVAK